MEFDTTFWFFDRIKNDKLCLLYNGSFSDDITDKFIVLSEYNLNNDVDLSKIKNKVSFLMAECFQNIVRHGEEKDKNEDVQFLPGFFATKNTDNTYFITSGNLIDKTKIEKLGNQLLHVNRLNTDELKELYRKVIENQEFSEKGGAGLGLIEMARKSGHKIDYSFKEYDDSLSFFYSQIRLTPKMDETIYPIDDAIRFHQKMNENDIMLIQKGDFSQETLLPVLKIIEQNFKKDKSSRIKKAVYHVLVELLQNISRHGLVVNNRHDGIFMIIQTGSKYIVTAGNYIEKNKVDEFETRLKIVQNASEEKLEEMYLQELENEDDSKPSGVGIGLTDIAREGSEPLSYHFQNIDSDKVFFTIQVVI